MFIQISKSGYNRHGEQYAHGLFLILMVDGSKEFSQRDRKAVRGLVRFVKMGQLGQFMMAKVKIKSHQIVLSGAYGADGLLKDVPGDVYALGLDLPPELYEKWAKSDGHNSTGNEEPAMRKWAKENLTKLQKK